MSSIRSVKRLSLIVLFIFLLSALSGCLQSPKNDNDGGEDFTFTMLDGTTKHLENYRGKIVVLDLMAVNCQPCIYETISLKNISENYSSDKVAIISIDVWISLGETPELVRDFIYAFNQQLDIELNWTFGVDDHQGTIMNKYAPEGVPTLYIFDQKGNIYYSHYGYENYATLASKLDELLKKE